MLVPRKNTIIKHKQISLYSYQPSSKNGNALLLQMKIQHTNITITEWCNMVIYCAEHVQLETQWYNINYFTWKICHCVPFFSLINSAVLKKSQLLFSLQNNVFQRALSYTTTNVRVTWSTELHYIKSVCLDRFIDLGAFLKEEKELKVHPTFSSFYLKKRECKLCSHRSLGVR